jgi:hypothetical protein
MNFKEITTEQMDAAKTKFLTHGKGVAMGNFMQFEDPNAVSAKWHDLLNPQKYSEHNIISKMKNLAVKMSQSCPDPILGKADVAHVHVTERDERIEYTYEDFYLFLRAALVERRGTEEYKIKKARIDELKKMVEQNKTVTEKRKDWKAELRELEESI